MAGAFPTIRSGVQALLPLTRTRSYQTSVVQFVNGSEQRWKKRAPVVRFEATMNDLRGTDRDAIVTFFNSQKGQFDSTWTWTFGGVTYSNLCFEEDLLRFEEKKPLLYSTVLKIRQVQNKGFATPSGSAVFPTMAAGAKTQLPYVQIRRFVTNVNDMDSGLRYAWEWFGAGLAGFPTGALMRWEFNYPSLSDADLATLHTFFQAMNGRWTTFSLTDPDDGTVHASCRFGSDDFTVTYLGPNQSSLKLIISETN